MLRSYVTGVTKLGKAHVRAEARLRVARLTQVPLFVSHPTLRFDLRELPKLSLAPRRDLRGAALRFPQLAQAGCHRRGYGHSLCHPPP
jgi:hypothetical protein